MKNYYNKGFSIIELIVGIFIFVLGLTSIYMLISSTINFNDYNKNQIIAANLSREGLELLKNLRDSNYENLHKWNLINPNIDNNFDLSSNYITNGYYKIWLDYNSLYPDFSVKLEKINNFKEGASFLTSNMRDYELCNDLSGKYTYDCSGGNKRTKIFRYLNIEPLSYIDSSGNNVIIANSYKVTSKVIWYIRGYHEINLTTVLSDYKKL
ncbi:MAG: prepilin-type N-terminal cleavage/methylation domain-containing protein [Candidatus Gracilibacteria bacterium]|nr:prepilin-type N-terminal cleavage/methylation domain-containing protein [Candidatus Gracilibacteria bacterium]